MFKLLKIESQKTIKVIARLIREDNTKRMARDNIKHLIFKLKTTATTTVITIVGKIKNLPVIVDKITLERAKENMVLEHIKSHLLVAVAIHNMGAIRGMKELLLVEDSKDTVVTMGEKDIMKDRISQDEDERKEVKSMDSLGHAEGREQAG